MSATIRKLSMTFTQKLVREPILHNIVSNYGVMFNIMKAQVSDEQGYLELSLEGDPEAVEKVVEYLAGLGVTINDA
jgi:ABC-type methionine transport system ATPase subunit